MSLANHREEDWPLPNAVLISRPIKLPPQGTRNLGVKKNYLGIKSSRQGSERRNQIGRLDAHMSRSYIKQKDV